MASKQNSVQTEWLMLLEHIILGVLLEFSLQIRRTTRDSSSTSWEFSWKRFSSVEKIFYFTPDWLWQVLYTALYPSSPWDSEKSDWSAIMWWKFIQSPSKVFFLKGSPLSVSFLWTLSKMDMWDRYDKRFGVILEKRTAPKHSLTLELDRQPTGRLELGIRTQ